MKITVENRQLDEIEILDVYSSERTEKMPAIIMLHGANGCKEKYLQRAYNYAQKGYFVTVFDAYENSDLKSFINSSGVDVKGALKTYTENSKYITRIADHYEHQEHVDAKRIALIGVSMGAHSLYYHILKERHPHIKVAVPMNGLPLWRGFIKKYLKGLNSTGEEIKEEYICYLEEHISTMDPLSGTENIKDLPLLILNGGNDSYIPINEVEEAFLRLKSSYENQVKLKKIVFENQEHIVTPEMLELACDWIQKHI